MNYRIVKRLKIFSKIKINSAEVIPTPSTRKTPDSLTNETLLLFRLPNLSRFSNKHLSIRGCNMQNEKKRAPP